MVESSLTPAVCPKCNLEPAILKATVKTIEDADWKAFCCDIEVVAKTRDGVIDRWNRIVDYYKPKNGMAMGER